MWPFRARCPLTPGDERWVHESARRLVHALSLTRVQDAQVLQPIPDHIPNIHDRKDESIQRVFASTARFIGVDPRKIRLQVYDDPVEVMRRRLRLQPAGELGGCILGTYDVERGPRIRISRDSIRDISGLVATVSHELAHHVLISELRFDPRDADHEPITDLAMVFLGLGWFGAKGSVIDVQWTGGGYEGYEYGKNGYLPPQLWGYALAIFAWLREERRPTWSKGLSSTVRACMKRGLRYLAKNARPGQLPLSVV